MEDNPYKMHEPDDQLEYTEPANVQDLENQIVSLKAEVRVGWDTIARQRDTIRDLTVKLYPDATFHDTCPDCGTMTVTDKDRNIVAHWGMNAQTGEMEETKCPGRNNANQ